jgi:hypothetical protein
VLDGRDEIGDGFVARVCAEVQPFVASAVWRTRPTLAGGANRLAPSGLPRRLEWRRVGIGGPAVGPVPGGAICSWDVAG